MLVPDFVFDSYIQITSKWLKEKMVAGILCDLDNTLSKYSDPEPPLQARKWVKTLINDGLRFGIVSNNPDIDRVKTHSKLLGVEFKAKCHKPNPGALLTFASEWNILPENIAVIGDQIFTDTLASSRAKMISVRVKPLALSPFSAIRLCAEAPFIFIARRRSACEKT